MGLKEKLKYETPFVLADYPVLYHDSKKLVPEIHTQLMLSSESYQTVFDNFCETIIDGIEHKKFIPVYRLADGEFDFIHRRLNDENSQTSRYFLKQKLMYLLFGKKAFGRNISVNKVEILKNLFDSDFNFNAYGEGYTRDESQRTKEAFFRNLREVARLGKLAFHFVKNDGLLVYREKVHQFFQWADTNGLDINEQNYLPFYHVYALVNGKIRKSLFKNRRILIVTSYDQPKKNALEAYFYEKEKVQRLEFIKISFF